MPHLSFKLKAVRQSVRTLTTRAGHFREGVVTAITLSANHTCLAGALTCFWVTCARTGTQMEAVTGETGVAIFRSIVVVLCKIDVRIVSKNIH